MSEVDPHNNESDNQQDDRLDPVILVPGDLFKNQSVAPDMLNQTHTFLL